MTRDITDDDTQPIDVLGDGQRTQAALEVALDTLEAIANGWIRGVDDQTKAALALYKINQILKGERK